MAMGSELFCKSETRRRATRKAALYGLDFAEVDLSPSDCTIQVFFLGKAPAQLVQGNVRISGGRRIRDVRVKSIRIEREEDPTLDDHLDVVVYRPGDASAYTLSLVALDDDGRPTDELMAGFDPRYGSIDFYFRAGCPTDLDCRLDRSCPPAQRDETEINYLAKDYDSFRQLMLDRLALTLPGFVETHVPDLGVTLVELLAYVADYLSYYQDAVATEAYLGTARQRISVRRHARLVDYFLHEGCNARAWLTLGTDQDCALDPNEIFFLSGLVDAPEYRVLQPSDYAQLEPGNYQVFEPLVADRAQPIQLRAAHNEIHFYTWGDSECCLSAGATSATLLDQWIEIEPPPATEKAAKVAGGSDGDGPPGTRRTLALTPGDVLIFEERVGPVTGNDADADPIRRQAVRLTKVTRAVDPLFQPNGPEFGQPVVEIEWCSEDALRFELCISVRGAPPGCDALQNVSVARGNVVLVDSGITVTDALGAVPEASRSETCGDICSPPDAVVTPGRFRPKLPKGPLTFCEPVPACACASTVLQRDPRRALPAIELSGTQQSAGGTIVTAWRARADLLESDGESPEFVVEIDDGGAACLRFGDGNLGRLPDAGTEFLARYRIGNGPHGNVGADSIRTIVFREAKTGVQLSPRNPLSATGGSAPESIDEAKFFAPFAFKNQLERAVTAEDYAALAADDARRLSYRASRSASAGGPYPAPQATTDDPRAADEVEPGEPPASAAGGCSGAFQRLQGARASLRWNGSWYEALVALDPAGREEAEPALVDEVTAYLERYRRIGHDLLVRGARYVPIALTLSVCVQPNYERAHVEAALLDVFGAGVRSDGSLGFFHPDNLRLGQDLYVSRIVAAAQTVLGVREVHVIELERFEPNEPTPDLEDELPADGVLALGPGEIARLDVDPSFPENGRLRLVMRGGR